VTTAVTAPPRSAARTLRRLAGQEAVLLLAVLLLFAVVGMTNPRFLAERNLETIFLGNAYVAVAAIGMSMVIISGNIDVSVGSLIGVLAVLSGSIAVAGWPIWLSWLLPVLAGMAATGVMGLLVAYLNVPSIVVTLGMLSILKGGLIMVTGGAWIGNLPQGYALAQMEPLGIAMPIWFMVVLTAGAAWWMRSSGLGRAIYAVGGNAEAARLFGIDRRAVRDPALGDPVDRSVRSRAHHHHRLGRRRGQHPRGHRHRDRLDPGGDPARGDRQLADLPQRLALLDPGGAGRADPRHRPRRPLAPPPGGAALRSGEPKERERHDDGTRPAP
jgi:ABC-type xylose transport system permease subunit